MSIDPEESAHLLREQVRYIARHAKKPFAVDLPMGRISIGEALPSRRHTCRCCAGSKDPKFPWPTGRSPHNVGPRSGRANTSPARCWARVYPPGRSPPPRAEGCRQRRGRDHRLRVRDGRTRVHRPDEHDGLGSAGDRSGRRTGARLGRHLRRAETPAALAIGGAGVAMGTRFIAKVENH